LFENTARELRNVSTSIQKLHIEHCTKADPAYGAGIVSALDRGLSKEEFNANN
jgi:catalase